MKRAFLHSFLKFFWTMPVSCQVVLVMLSITSLLLSHDTDQSENPLPLDTGMGSGMGNVTQPGLTRPFTGIDGRILQEESVFLCHISPRMLGVCGCQWPSCLHRKSTSMQKKIILTEP